MEQGSKIKMEPTGIDELIQSKKCLDMLHDGVCYELHDNVYVDTQDDNVAEINALTSAIVEVFYAWLRYNNISIEISNIKESK